MGKPQLTSSLAINTAAYGPWYIEPEKANYYLLLSCFGFVKGIILMLFYVLIFVYLAIERLNSSLRIYLDCQSPSGWKLRWIWMNWSGRRTTWFYVFQLIRLITWQRRRCKSTKVLPKWQLRIKFYDIIMKIYLLIKELKIKIEN